MIREVYSAVEPLLLEITDSTVYKRSDIELIEDVDKGLTLYKYNEETLSIPDYINTLMNEEDYDALALVVTNLSNKVDDLEARIIALENA